MAYARLKPAVVAVVDEWWLEDGDIDGQRRVATFAK